MNAGDGVRVDLTARERYPNMEWQCLIGIQGPLTEQIAAALDELDVLRAALGREIANSDRLAAELDNLSRPASVADLNARIMARREALAAHVGVVEQRSTEPESYTMNSASKVER